MIGVNSIDGKRRRFHIRAFERLDMVSNRFTAKQRAIFLWINENRGEFKKRIGPAIKSTRLDVNDNREKSSESP